MIVADASLIVSLLIDRGPTGQAARKAFSDAGMVSIPDLAYVETVAALRKQWHRGIISIDRGREAVSDLTDLPLTVYPTHLLMPRVFELWDNLTAYDACYVALAEFLKCDLVTGDRRLARATGPRCQIRTLGQNPLGEG